MKLAHNWVFSKPIFESDKINPRLKVEPWNGHRFFAYDLIKNLKPQVVVELGVHWGCSFFSFAQSVVDNEIDCRLYGVDTWRGDEQAGYYGNEVFDTVNKTLSDLFDMDKTKLVRMLFSDAAELFDNESIDVVHIDGLHTYEAVKDDCFTWLPKLKKNGIMLFHDIASRTGDGLENTYGSRVFWKEISARYPNFQFDHSWGLGVLFPKGDFVYREIIGHAPINLVDYYQAIGLLELKKIQYVDMSRMIEERDNHISKLKEILRAKEEELTILNSKLTEIEIIQKRNTVKGYLNRLKSHIINKL